MDGYLMKFLLFFKLKKLLICTLDKNVVISKIVPGLPQNLSSIVFINIWTQFSFIEHWFFFFLRLSNIDFGRPKSLPKSRDGLLCMKRKIMTKCFNLGHLTRPLAHPGRCFVGLDGYVAILFIFSRTGNFYMTYKLDTSPT